MVSKCDSRLICAQRTAQFEPSLVRVIREGATMTDAKPSSPWPEDGSSSRSSPASDELELLREETKRLRQLVVQLSRIAIRNAVNMK
jgi:hypothetical protein